MATQESIFKIIIQEIEDFNLRMVEIKSSRGGFELIEDGQLSANLSGGVGAFFVRSALSLMNIDEHHVFMWHLENKYMQYLIFNHYCRGCMPVTYSLSAILYRSNSIALVKRLFKHHYFLKATLGHGSGRTNSFDRTIEFDKIIKSYQLRGDYDEEWILQKKLCLTHEYRIHTFGKEILYGLTFKISGQNSVGNEPAIAFLADFFKKVPVSLFSGNLIAWDIGLDNTGRYYIIEANFTGFHPHYRRGFQTTGFVEDNSYGPICCALLNCHWKYKYGTFIDSISDGLLSVFQFYRACIFYMNLFQQLDLTKYKQSDQIPDVIIHLEKSANTFITTLINYFQLVNFAKKYYVIVQKGSDGEASRLFQSFHQVQLIFESSLFTEDQYILLKHLSPQRQKQMSCYHALRRMKIGLAIMLYH